jgi:hypothetical protein
MIDHPNLPDPVDAIHNTTEPPPPNEVDERIKALSKFPMICPVGICGWMIGPMVALDGTRINPIDVMAEYHRMMAEHLHDDHAAKYAWEE